MPQIKVGQETAIYRERGEGEKDLLLVHGAGGSSLNWDAVEPPPGWRILALDLPGHGLSGGQPKSDVSAYADFVTGFIEVSGLKPVLVGHSMGGAVAMTVARERPGLLSGLVLAATGARLGVAPQILEICLAGDSAKLQQLVDSFAYGPQVSSDRIAEWNRQSEPASCETYLADFTACNKFDIRESLPHIRYKTLVVCGDSDRLTPLKYSQYLTETLPSATLTVLPGSGHMLMLEQPRAFNKALADFCSQL